MLLIIYINGADGIKDFDNLQFILTRTQHNFEKLKDTTSTDNSGKAIVLITSITL